MSTNKNASIRYKALDKCFRDFRHRYFMEDLIEKCEEELESFNFKGQVGRRQIYDDIRYMESEAGWSVPLEKLKDGTRTYYRYSDKNFTINAQPLNDDEAQQIKTMVLTLSRFRGFPGSKWVEELIANLQLRFNIKGQKETIIGFEQNTNLKGLELLPKVLDATSNHQVVEILYHNYKNGGRDIFFTLHPYFVKQYNNRWFLFGLENEHKSISVLALDRIVKMDSVDDITFIENTDCDFDHYFDDFIGVTMPKPEIKKDHIVLKFSKERFPYIKSKFIHHSQDIVNEEECTVSIDVRPNVELDSKILSFIPDVIVISPETYKQHIIGLIKENIDKYNLVQNDRTDDK